MQLPHFVCPAQLASLARMRILENANRVPQANTPQKARMYVRPASQAKSRQTTSFAASALQESTETLT